MLFSALRCDPSFVAIGLNLCRSKEVASEEIITFVGSKLTLFFLPKKAVPSMLPCFVSSWWYLPSIIQKWGWMKYTITIKKWREVRLLSGPSELKFKFKLERNCARLHCMVPHLSLCSDAIVSTTGCSCSNLAMELQKLWVGFIPRSVPFLAATVEPLLGGACFHHFSCCQISYNFFDI